MTNIWIFHHMMAKLNIFLDFCLNIISDCAGKMCYNGGSMDYNTCTCKCATPYTGSSCENSKFSWK